MASIVRWLHLSDFHVGKDDYATRKMFEYIIRHVRDRKSFGIAPDLVFVTGDLANRGQPAEYEMFWNDFGLPLLIEIGGDIEDRIFAIPGNHDVDRRENPAFNREEISRPTSHYFDPTAEGSRLRQMLLLRLKAFQEGDATNSKGAFATDAGAFTKVISVAGRTVGIAGINTAWLCKDDTDKEKLTPGKPLLEQALKALEGADVRIVLGHHPLDWLVPSEQRAIKSLLGKHSVLYLHGHLHETWAEPNDGSGNGFLTIQSGACFQAREGEPWRNGLVWGEVDLDKQVVRLQPWRWVPDHQDWALAADAFPEVRRLEDWWEYPLPGTAAAIRHVKSPPLAPIALPPKGWRVVATSDLAAHLKPLPEEAAVRFFNGAVPGLHTALSTSIPRRKIVGTLAAHFHDADRTSRPIVVLLLAPACEGKTTSLLQSAYEIVKGDPKWRMLLRTDDAASLTPTDILPLLGSADRWLIVIDEADRVAASLIALIQRLPAEVQGRVHFLIACRESDWQAAGAQNHSWSSLSTFKLERLAGLVTPDAEAIVKAWADFGKAGLGDLAAVPPEQWVGVLDRQVHEEAKTSLGAFFGALLAVRHGSDLPDHARLMLERLSQRAIPSGGTVRDALAFIAAMHAEGLEFLSRPVLAQALGCPLDKLHKHVVAPLGAEAAATTTSSFLFTRHRRIALAVISVMESDFAEDISALYERLAIAAVDAFVQGDHVPQLAAWRYTLAEHFFNSGRDELALRIAAGVLSREPTNHMTLVKVAQLHRRAASSEKATALFRDYPQKQKTDRAFFYEWAVCEGELGNTPTNIVLAAFSLSDTSGITRLSNDDATMGLVGLGVSLGKAFVAHHDLKLRDAQAAATALGLQLYLDERARDNLERNAREAVNAGATLPAIADAIEIMHRGVIAAQSIGVHEDAANLTGDVSSFEFEGLRRLIEDTVEARKQRR